MSRRERIYLSVEEMPKYWYNVLADLPFQLDPPLNPQTREVLKPEELGAIFPQPLVEQEVTTERFIKIPKKVFDEYAVFRPSPLIRASNLEEYLETPAKIYYKYEGVSPTGSHKTNTSIPQAYYNMISGTKTLVTETGAGQWGTALSYAGLKFGLNIEVYMVKTSFEQKPMRKLIINFFGGKVSPSPSLNTEFGKKMLDIDRENPGSLGIAISEALEEVFKKDNAKYALGSVLNHVLLHQTIIGLEIKKQFEKINIKPDVIIGCHGGGSNLGGTILPFIPEKLSGEKIEFLACEPKSCPTLTEGEYRYDNGDTAGLTPLMMMYTLGKEFIPPKIHAGGLRYHGSAPIIAKLKHENMLNAIALDQEETFEAARIFSKLEGIIPAPESSHAIAGAIREAIKAKENKEEKVIVFTLSGHGLLDLTAYA
ncbi:TrpB-like pyridoxal phosphate-dependent enzyme [Marinitoga aeolica]|uniref:Tryptophan synthase beta chain n=1 Tax=Marinitoga aeolica TaxID=2809031 RepID=A0ABY8PQT0_9BACT|nr:TrpB-like pyridoxal phosphate-dependent enzyme [Marinitoga aeolica]WGS64975.1 TrpB-like pyridoxal phosphate-dependent enzyme [Marinitoga aeolica]